MKKVILFFLFFPVSVSLANAPVSISLSYDMAKGNLHVDAVHPSFNLEKDYIRVMNIYVNGTQIQTLSYFRQNDYNDFVEDVPVTAQVGDVIKVDLFASLGGELDQELNVTGPGVSQTD